MRESIESESESLAQSMNEYGENNELVSHARQAFRTHLVTKALVARKKYDNNVDSHAIQKMLNDREVVRYPAVLHFDAQALRDNEFAYAHPFGFHPGNGYCLFIHSHFENRPDVWPALVAYHIPTINYGNIVEPDDAELYGATLLGLDVDTYYHQLCAYLAELNAYRGN